MANVIAKSLRDAESHLRLMIAKEKTSGDFLLASVVQDSLLYSLHGYAKGPELMRIAHGASELSIKAATEAMYLNEFTVRESVRGAMHSVLSLGGEATAMAVAVTTGALSALNQGASDNTRRFLPAIVLGICIAADEMGIKQDVQSVSQHLVEVALASHIHEKLA